MSRSFYMGIDPGYSGSVAVVDEGGAIFEVIRLDRTEHDVSTAVGVWAPRIQMAYLEKVHSMPRQGVSSTFKFGTSYGFCRGVLVSHAIPFTEVTPAKWQQAMGCRSGGDKNVTKAAAQRLWPSEKVTHRTADAMLIAEYGRRKWSSM